MLPRSAIQSGTNGRRTATLIAVVAVVLSVPVMIYAFGANPPLGYTGAPGQGTCASCHGTLTTGSGVTVNAPSSYTPGGPAISMTVTIPSIGGFELAVLTQSGNTQAGTLAAGPPPAGAAFPQDAVSTVGTIKYVYSTVETTSWKVSWTPPATTIGNVVVYVTGGSHSPNYSNSYTITPSAPPTTTTARRVRLQASSTTAFPGDTFVIAAVGTEGVGGAGSDLTEDAEGNFCDIQFNSVQIDEDGQTAVLVGKVVDAADPKNLGAFVKITAHTGGTVNFVFQPPVTNLGTGAAGIDFTGATVSIVNIL